MAKYTALKRISSTIGPCVTNLSYHNQGLEMKGFLEYECALGEDMRAEEDGVPNQNFDDRHHIELEIEALCERL